MNLTRIRHMTQHNTQIRKPSSKAAEKHGRLHRASYHKNKQDSISQSVLYEQLLSRDVKARWWTVSNLWSLKKKI